MYVYFEENSSSRCDSTIHCLSWMGKVPDSLSDEDGWKLNRTEYYQEGWLAVGNAKGVVGVTFTTSHCQKYDPPPRSNFNLRGHRSEVVLVRWNEPYQKLATCDSHGIIFVWIKHEGRWSIELINDRNSQVTDFAWSHDGRMALICYRDGFVLVGSVAGQRYWSSMLNLDGSSITCGVWSSDDQKVIFGTSDGQLVVMSSAGSMLVQVTVQEGMEIIAMAWSCEKFNMDESDSVRCPQKTSFPDATSSLNEPRLAVCFKHGAIFLMSNYDDVCPIVINTMLTGLKLDWSNCGEVLAVAGFVRLPNLQCKNEVHFYSLEGSLSYKIAVPSQGKPLTALTWGHNDKRLFVAAGCVIHVAWVTKQVASLQFLSHRCIQKVVRLEKNITKLRFPSKLKSGVRALFSPTIKSYIPDPFRLREFVSSLPPGNERLYCTMIRHGEETSGGHYTLYLEYLGGLVPLLKGKRASKIRPDFIIFDPKIKTLGSRPARQEDVSGFSDGESEHDSDSDVSIDGCGSPRMQRRKRQKQFRAEKVERSITFRTLDELFYNDNLPESNKLVEITSNIWGTRFRMVGLASYLPEDLGQVLYKTSLLHLQPRQMTVNVAELGACNLQHYSRDPNFTPAGHGEEEDCREFMDLGIFHHFSVDEGAAISPTDVCVHTEPLPRPCETQEFLSTDIIFNRSDVGVQYDCAVIKSGSRTNSELSSPTKNGSNLFRCSAKQHRTSSVKSRTLSPAENHSTAQNNAFHDGQEPNDLLKDSYLQQGAIPKSSSRLGSHIQCIPSPWSQADPSTVGRVLQQDLQNTRMPRWADRACPGICFIDDEKCEGLDAPVEANTIYDSSNVTLSVTSESERRLYLAHHHPHPEAQYDDHRPTSPQGGNHSESRETCVLENSLQSTYLSNAIEKILDVSEKEVNSLLVKHGSLDTGIDELGLRPEPQRLEEEIVQSASLPASPIKKKSSRAKKLKPDIFLNATKLSPLFGRKRRSCPVDSSEEELSSMEEIRAGQDYTNLEAFQKAQFKQKLRRVKSKSDKCSGQNMKRKLLVMHNKAPLWNESSQVYQLDFGGRVTQESAKNFQIEYQGIQVMQFGRIDGNAYTLDFQYPFSALQAFGVALANVTQRLK